MYTLVSNHCWTRQMLEIICKTGIFTDLLLCYFLKKYTLHNKLESYYLLSTKCKKLTIAKIEVQTSDISHRRLPLHHLNNINHHCWYPWRNPNAFLLVYAFTLTRFWKLLRKRQRHQYLNYFIKNKNAVGHIKSNNFF